jgi:hypothetical protein
MFYMYEFVISSIKILSSIISMIVVVVVVVMIIQVNLG